MSKTNSDLFSTASFDKNSKKDVPQWLEDITENKKSVEIEGIGTGDAPNKTPNKTYHDPLANLTNAETIAHFEKSLSVEIPTHLLPLASSQSNNDLGSINTNNSKTSQSAKYGRRASIQSQPTSDFQTSSSAHTSPFHKILSDTSEIFVSKSTKKLENYKIWNPLQYFSNKAGGEN
ncbi:uncharacterized protein LOC123296502 [Chrysoperla carnea]|uniref:uncharacterized protein LOC123296502 n=1 Tax=Chrysoperla carnea TaxID=189513 RepID=UPI001D07BDD9|nr:uncharacterized protein LOC123296502 [Chrysoperla carnea]